MASATAPKNIGFDKPPSGLEPPGGFMGFKIRGHPLNQRHPRSIHRFFLPLVDEHFVSKFSG